MKYKKLFSFLFVSVLFLVGGFAFSVPKVYAVAVNVATNIEVTPGTQFTIFKGVPVYRLVVTNSSGVDSDTITSLSPTPSGSVVDTTVTLHFYHDVNNNGIVDQGDVDIGADGNFGADNAFTIFNINDVIVPAAGSASILITADVGAGVGAQTFNLAFAAGTDIVMTTTPTGTFPLLNDATLTVSNSAPSVTIVNASNDPATKTVAVGASNVPVKRLAITAAAGTSDSIVSLAPAPTGTANDNTGITSVVFYIDSGTTPGVVDENGSDIRLVTTPATYTGDDAPTTFTFSSPFQVTAFSTVNILVVYNLAGGIAPASTPSATGVSSYAFGNTLVKLRTRDDYCRAWQHFFNDKFNGHLVTDGICGPLTIATAKAWQASVDLVTDGVLGPLSRAKASMQ